MTPGQRAASSALDQAQRGRLASEELKPEVAAAAAKLRAANLRNHFAESIMIIFEASQRGRT